MNIDIANPDDRARMISAIGNMIQSTLDDKSINQHAELILDEYIVRTNHHVWLVGQCAKILRDIVIRTGQNIEMFDTNIEFHDYDKLHNDVILPTYALACHYFYFHNKDVKYKVDEEWLNHEFEDVAWPKHHQNNKHHYAEFYGKINNAGVLDVPETYDILNLVEMYADWMAMGITNGGTAHEWWTANYGPKNKFDFHGRDLGIIQQCILAEDNAVNQLTYLRQFKDVEPTWVPPTEIETFEEEDPLAIKAINEGIENFFNYESNESLSLKRDDMYIGPIDPMIIDPEKMMKLAEYPDLLLALKKWTNKPDYNLSPQLIMLGKIVDDLYKFKNPIICYRGIRTGFDSRSNKKQNLMGIIDNDIEYLRLLKPGFDKAGTTFEYEAQEPMSVARSPYIAKIYGNFIIKTEVPADANKLVITPELSYLLQQMEVEYPEYRAVNLSVTHEVIVFTGTKLTFEIVSVFGDISSELETMKEHSFEGLGDTEMNGSYFSIESVSETKDKLPEFLYISGTETNIKDGYLSFKKTDTTWDEESKEWNNNFDVYKTPNGVKRELQKPNHHLNKNTTYYAIGLPTELIKDSVFFEKGKIWFRPQKDYTIKAKEWNAIVLDLGKTTSSSTESVSPTAKVMTNVPTRLYIATKSKTIGRIVAIDKKHAICSACRRSEDRNILANYDKSSVSPLGVNISGFDSNKTSGVIRYTVKELTVYEIDTKQLSGQFTYEGIEHKHILRYEGNINDLKNNAKQIDHMTDVPVTIRYGSYDDQSVEWLNNEYEIDSNSSTEALSTKEYTEADINSVEDLKEFYKHCSYGLIDFKANKPWKETHKNTTFEDWEKEWRLLSVEQLLKFKCGICYDTAKANDYFLTKWNIDHVNLFAYTKRSAGDDYNDDPTHTFTVYKDTDGKWKWLEGSWGSFKNNDWSESSSDALIKNIGKALANEAGVTNLIGVITSWPKDGVSMNEFYHALKDQAIKRYKYEIKPEASYSNEALSPDIKKKKQLIIDYICSVCDIMDPSKLNSKRYHRLLDSMSDKEFDQWMQYVKDGKWKIHIVAPNLVVTLKNENSLKAADKVKCKLFHRLWMTDDSTGRQYLTDNEYLVLNLPVRRQQQFLDEKMSVPDNDKQIDGLTGQVTGDSKSSSVTNPEIQILAARGLDATLEEFVNVRGGNIAAYSDFKRQAEETGEIKLNSLDPNTRSRVAVVGQVLLRSMMIENNILE